MSVSVQTLTVVAELSGWRQQQKWKTWQSNFSKEDIQKAIKVEGLSEPVFIENQTTTKENEQKKYKLELEWNGEEIVKEKLIKNLLNAHISILNFNVNSNNLEKIFMQLTEDTNVDNL